MPQKYEREIEEILRNFETDDSPQEHEQILKFRRPKRTRVHSPRTGVSVNLSTTEQLLLASCIVAIIAGGMASAWQVNQFSGMIACLAFVLFVCGASYTWFSHGSLYSPTWRGQQLQTKGTPWFLSPFRYIATQFRIVRLKILYWKNRPR